MEFLNALKAQAFANPLAAVSAGVVLIGTIKSYRMINSCGEVMIEMTESIVDMVEPGRQYVPDRYNYRTRRSSRQY